MIRNVLSFNELKKFCTGATLTVGSDCFSAESPAEGSPLASGEAPFIGECCVAVNERSVRENCTAGLFAFWAKAVAVVMLCVMAMSGQGWALSSSPDTTFGGKSYYKIATCDDLVAFSTKVNTNTGGNYGNAGINAILMADIDVSTCNTNFTPIGNRTTASNVYSGTFNGNGHVISKLKVANTVTSGGVYIGLFGCLTGSVDNLIIYDLTMTTQTAQGKDDFVGGIAGYLKGGSVTNCTVAGESVIEARRKIGGIVGKAEGGTISNCLSSVSLRSPATGESGDIGGICGNADANTRISSSVYVGAMIDKTCVDEGTCLCTGNNGTCKDGDPKYPTSHQYAISGGNATITNCYYDSDINDGLNGEILGGTGISGGSNINTEEIACALNGGTWKPSLGVCLDGDGPWTAGDEISNHGGMHTGGGDATSYDVVFDANSGSFANNVKSKTIEVNANTAIDTAGLTFPTRDGDTFIGWAKASNATEAVALGNAVGSVTYYAVWGNSYEIAFNANGGTVPSNAVTKKRVTKNAAINVDGITTPEAPLGTVFVGWSTNKNASSADESLGTATEPKTFYAVYTGEFMVTFNSNGHGTFANGAVRTKMVSVGASITAEGITQPTANTGYDFVGWSRNASATAADANLGVMGTAPVTVYAVWEADSVTITFNPNGGYFDGSNTSANRNSRTKKVVVGDVINSNGISNSSPVVKKEPYNTDSTCAEYACESCEKGYSLNKNGQCKKNGSVGSCKTTSSTCRQWSFTTHNYTFMGWNANAEATGIEDLGNASTAKTVYAIFTDAPVYMVTFNANGHGSVPEDQAVLRTSGIVTQPENLATTGFTFGGWYTDAGCADAHRFDFNTTISSNITLYAKWTANTHNLTMNVADRNGNVLEILVQKVVSVDSVVSAALPSTEGYAYTDWRTTSDGVTITDGEFRMPDNDVVMTTIRTAGKYELVWNVVNGTIDPTGSNYTPNGEVYFNTPLVPPTVFRTGYEFRGWTLDGETIIAPADFATRTMPAQKQTYIAVWNPLMYTITYTVFGASYGTEGQVYETQTNIVYGAEITEKPSPSEANYDFRGWVWKNANTMQEISKPSKMPDYDLVVEGTFTLKKFNVTFDGNGQAVNIPAQSVEHNGYVTRPEDPAVTGYRFDGWFKEAACTNAWNFASDKVTAATTLYAKWTAIYEVTFDGNGQTVDIPVLKVDQNGLATKPEDPSVAGYRFNGWFKEAACTNAWDFATENVVGNTTLYAKWTLESYTITYNNLHEGQTNTNPADYTITSETITLVAPGDSTGYTFDGWYGDADFSGDAITQIAQGSMGERVLFAKWTIKTHTITYQYSVDGGNTYTIIGEGPVTVDFGSEQIRQETYIKLGYTMSAWTVSPEALAITESGAFIMPDEDVVFSTIGTKNSYTITYYVDGVQDGEVETAVLEDAVTPRENPTKTGYTFSGWTWYSLADASNPVQLEESPKAMPAYNLKAVGTFAPTQYTATFDANEGVFAEGAVTSKLVDFDAAITAEGISEPTREGYAFKGWALAQNATVAAENLGTMNSTEGVTIYAVWVQTFTVTFVKNGHGSDVESQIVESGSNVVKPDDLSETGYTFAGWFTDDAFASEYVFGTPVMANVNLYAKWTVQVTFDMNDHGTAIDAQTVTVGSAAIAPTDPTADGFRFDGWYTDDETFQNAYDFANTAVTEAVTLHAKWTALYTVTWKNGDETVKTDVDVAEGTLAGTIAPETPTKTGYTFGGWSDGTTTFTVGAEGTLASLAINAATTFTAVWNINQHKVTYKVDGVVVGDEEQYDFAAPVTLRGKYLKPGYTVTEWALPEGLTLTDGKFSMPDGDVVITATSTIDQYTVTYAGLYAGQTNTNPTSYTVTSETITLVNPGDSTGYTFGGWYDNADFNGDAVTQIVKGSMGDKTLYAKWTINKNTVTYKITGEYFATESFNVQENVAYGTALTLITDDMTKEGYTFSGWSTLPATMPDNAVVVTGSYTKNAYTVTYKITGEYFATESFNVQENVAYGTALTLIDDNMAKEGYTFSGWSELPATMPDNAVVVTGSYTKNSYTVTYKITGDYFAAESFKVQENVAYGTALTLITDDMTKEGYTFSGWSELPATMPDEAVVVTGSYTKNAYSVTYKITGEYFATESFNVQENVAYGTALTLIDDNMAKEGYTFSGWSTLPATMPDNAVVVTGSYTKNAYTVTYKITGDYFAAESFKVQENVAYGTTLTLIDDNMAKEGYTFSGWSTLPATMPDNAVVVTGSYTKNAYTVTYKITGEYFAAESFNVQENVAYGTALTLISDDMTKEGYTFSGWSTLPATMPDNAVVVTGSYTKNAYTITYNGLYEGQTNTNPTSYTVTSETITLVNPGDSTGYTFDGWYDGENKVTTIATGTTGDKTLMARWTVNRYTVTWWKSEEKRQAHDQKTDVPFDSVITAPTKDAPTKQGYLFDMWTSADVTVAEDGSFTMPAKAVDLVPAWKLETYSITYELDGGTNAISNPATYNFETETFNFADPTRDGFVFLGWYGESDFSGEKITGVEKGSVGDMTLHAKWASDTYTITYNPGNHGVGELAADYKAYGEAFALSASKKYTRVGYTQVGWATEKEGAQVYALGASYETDADITLYPVWQINSHSVTFMVGEKIIRYDGEVTYGMEVTAPTAPDSLGYTFAQWQSDNEGISSLGVNGKFNMIDEDVVAKALYWVDTYKLTYDLDDGTCGTCSELTGYNVTQNVTLPTDVEKTGYTFAGWYDNDKFEGNAVTEIAKNSTGDKKFYAKWTINNYTITYKITGDYFKNDAFVTGSADFGTVVDTTTTSTVQEGYTFSGWSVAEGGVTLENGKFTMGTANVVLTGSYSINSYDVVWKKDDATYSSSSVAYGVKVVAPATAPTKNGYDFAGWTTSDVVLADDFSFTMPAKAVTLNADWDLVTYEIAYESNGGQTVPSSNYTIESADITLPTTTRLGYDFGGWFDNEDLSGTAVTKVAAGSFGNKKFYAKWDVVTYNITYTGLGDMTHENPVTYTVEDAVVLTDPTDSTGYSFDGWYIGEDKVTGIAKGSTGAKTMVAKWTPKNVEFKVVYELYGATGSKEKTMDEVTLEGPADAPIIDNITWKDFGDGYDYELVYINDVEHNKSYFTDKIARDGSTVVKVRVEHNEFTFTFYTEGESGWKEWDEQLWLYGYDYVENNKVKAPTAPTKTGYTFVGWCADAETCESVQTFPMNVPAKNMAFYAKWTINPYTITFDTKGGSTVDAITQDYNTAVTAPENPTRAGYLFAGWDKEIPATMPAEDITITAKWNMDVKASGYTGVYDGDAHGITVTAPEGATITYSTAEDGDYVATLTYADVGTYTVYYKASQEGYADVKGSATVAITPATMTLVVAGYADTYDGAAHSGTATPSVTEGTTVSYKVGEGDWSTTAPTIKDVGEISVSVKAENANYETATNSYTLKVTKRAVTLTGETATKDFTGVEINLSSIIVGGAGLVDGHTHNATYSAKGLNAGSYAGSITAADDVKIMSGATDVTKNYAITTQAGSLTILSAGTFTIALDTASFIYDGTAHHNAKTATSTAASGTTTFQYSLDSTAWVSDLASLTETNAGTYTIYVVGTNTNYPAAAVAKSSLAIAKASVTITVAAAEKTYGDADPEFTGKVEGLVAASDLGEIKYVRVGAGQNVGTYSDSLTATYVPNDNYDVNVVPATFTITPKAITVAVAGATSSVVYDGAEHAVSGFTATTSDELYNVNSVVLAEGKTASATTTNVGKVFMNLTYASFVNNDANFTVTFNVTDGYSEVTPKAAVVKAVAASKIYGDTDPTFTATVVGTIGEDKVEYSLVRAEGENVGEYSITASGDAEQGNYSVTFANGSFTISKKSVTITVAAASKTYGEADPVFTGKVEGLVNEDDLGVIMYIRTNTTTVENAGTYPNVLTVNFTDNENYSVTVVKADFTVNKRSVTFTGESMTKGYTGEEFELTAFAIGGDGLVEGHSHNVTYSVKGAEVGKYTGSITDVADVKIMAGETDVTANYAITTEAGKLTIQAAGVFSIALKNDTYTFDGLAHYNAKTATSTAKSGTTTFQYQFNGDGDIWVSDLASLTKTDVGTYTINVKAVNANYGDIATTTAKLTILPKTATVSAVAAGKITGSKDPELFATVTGLVGEDKVEYVVTRTEGETVGNYLVTPVGAEVQGNYKIVYETARFVISPAVKVVLAEGMELLCTESTCDADGYIKHIFGSETTMPLAKVSGDEAWKFQGWFDNPNGVGSPVTKIAGDIEKDTILYPYFTKTINAKVDSSEVTVVVDMDDTQDSLDRKVTFEARITLPVPNKSSDNLYTYRFTKYAYNAKTDIYESQFTPVPRTFRILFNLPEGAVLSTEIETYTYGETTKLPTASIKGAEDWEFKGWYTKPDGNGTRVKVISAGEFGEKTLYPLFQKTIAYDANGARGEVSAIYAENAEMVINAALADVVPQDYVKKGKTYSFDKWVLENGTYVAKFTQTDALKAASVPHFTVSVMNRVLEISGARMGAKVAVFDMRGTLVASGIVENGTQRVEIAQPGSYIVRVNNQVRRVNIR